MGQSNTTVADGEAKAERREAPPGIFGLHAVRIDGLSAPFFVSNYLILIWLMPLGSFLVTNG